MIWPPRPAGSGWARTMTRQLCGADHPALVAGDRATALPWSQEPDHYGRWGRLERGAGAAVEAGGATAGPGGRGGPPGPSSAARPLEVERDRAPAVRVHQPELARHAAGELPCHRGPDRRNHHQGWPERAVRT